MLKCEKMWALDSMEITARGCKICPFLWLCTDASALPREAGPLGSYITMQHTQLPGTEGRKTHTYVHWTLKQGGVFSFLFLFLLKLFSIK